MKSSLWAVFVVVAGFVGFLIGYSVSSYTGIQKVGYVERAESSGYGGETGGYGAETGSYGKGAPAEKESAEFGERLEYFGGK